MDSRRVVWANHGRKVVKGGGAYGCGNEKMPQVLAHQTALRQLKAYHTLSIRDFKGDYKYEII